MESWSVYIVRCVDGSLYTGIAKDVARRVDEHNANNLLAANYTRARRPVTLVYQEAVASRSAAAKREYEIKCLSRAEKQALVRGYGDENLRALEPDDAKGGETMKNGDHKQEAKGKQAGKTSYVLIDYENVQVKSLALLKGGWKI
jgi:putative endonuclease